MKEIKYNNVILGEAILDASGVYYFYPTRGGGWSEFALKYVLDKLTELNKEYTELLNR